MNKRKYLNLFSLIVLFCFVLTLSSSAEYDNTRRMKAKAEHYFDNSDYYKAIDIWAEVLKIDSHDKEALLGIQKAQELLGESQDEEERAERQKLKELIRKGKNYHRDREYKKALSSWGQALSIDPTNKEVLNLIEEVRIRAEYQISILDKLDREKRLKTPHIDDLDKVADKMINLLEKTDVKVREEKKERIEGEIEEEERIAVQEEERIRREKEKIRIEDVVAGRPKADEAISKEKRLLPPTPRLRGTGRPLRGLAMMGWTRLPQNARIIIGIIALLALLLIVKITFRAKAKSPVVKAPPNKAKKEEFEPRDLKKFLKKKPEDKDKDLFK